jgi:CHAT domain-containing protein/tetratricopeptide (TPR) repeat protein
MDRTSWLGFWRSRFVAPLLAIIAVTGPALFAGPARAQQREDPVWARLLDSATARYREGRFEEALQLNRQAEARGRSLSRLPGDLVVLPLLGQAKSLEVLRRYGEQKVALEEALRVARAAYGERSPSVALVLNNLSNMYFSQGQLVQAQQQLQTSIDIEKALGNRHGIAVGLGNMAWLLINLLDYPRADAAVRQAIEIFESLREVRQLAHQYRTLATIRSSMGDRASAHSALKKAIAIDDTEQNGLNLAAAADRCQLAGLTSDTDEALKYYDQCLRLRERLVLPNDPRYGIIAETLESIASVYKAQGSHDRSIALYQRAVDIRGRMFGVDSLESGLALTRLARAYWDKDDTEKALEISRDASELLRKHGASQRDKKDSLNLLGQILIQADLREYRVKAKEIYQQLAEQERKAGLWPAYATTLLQLGIACVKIDDKKCAYEAMLAALANRRRLYPEPSMRVAVAHLGYGSALYWFHDYAQAAQEFGAAFEQWRRLGGASAESPFSNIDTNIYIDSLWRTRSGDPTRRDAEAILSFRVCQLSHQSDAGRALAQLAARIAAGGGENALLVRREQDLSRQHDRLQGEYGDLLANSSDADRATKTENLRRQIGQIAAAIDSARQALAARVPAYRTLATAEVLEPSRIQTLLSPKDLLLVFNFGPKGGFVWAVSPNGITWSKIDLTDKQLADEVKALRQGLDFGAQFANRGFTIKPSASPESDPLPFDRGRSYALYQALLGGVKSQVGAAQHLMFVPAGALESLPPAVLVSKPSPSSVPAINHYRKTAWLVRDKAISIVPSVSTLAMWKGIHNGGRLPPRHFLGVGDPLMKRFSELARCSTAIASKAAVLSTLDPVVGATAELNNIARSLGAPVHDLLLGERASEESILRTDLSAYRILAFSTHGLMANELPGLKEPALVLTPPAVCASDGGLLTASKVAQLRLDADWVILSACNTAAGDGSGSTQGLSGLARAFFYAGARAVLVSHWAVAEAAAVALTTGTIRALAKDRGLGKAQALQQAMVSLMDDDSIRLSAHPAFWAPFVVVGE